MVRVLIRELDRVLILWKVPILVLLVSIYGIGATSRSQTYLFRTTYVGQVMAYENNEEPDATLATRIGEFAMLLYSIGA